MHAKSFRFGDWLVDRAACTLTPVQGGDGAALAIEPRAMDVLTALCGRPGEVLSAADLLRLCWDGLTVGENQVHKAIAQLRRAFGDSASQPRYIENIRKRGYRTVAPVTLEERPGAPVPESWPQGSPYVGLDPFDTDRAGLFFGRDAAVARLLEAVAGQIARQRCLVLVLGPSGSGKTSLVQAGLVPALHRSGRAGALVAGITLDLGDIGPSSPLTAVGSALLDWEIDGQPVLAGRSAEEIGDGLASGRELELSVLRQAASTQPDGQFLLFIDRLEAIFDAGVADEAQKSRFLTALDRLARSGSIIVVAACRNDFYPAVAREPLLMEGKPSGAHFDLGPPSRNEISQMIRRPAQAAGLSFETVPGGTDSLSDLLCDAAVQSPDALPLLQYTLQELYFQRSPTRQLTIAAYRALGGLEGAIGKRAEAALADLPKAAQAALTRVLPLVVQIDADDGLVRSRRVPWSALGGEEERVLVRALVEQRLFVTLGHDGAPMFGLAHEALLRQWPRVVEWIGEHRQALRVRGRLEAAARQWIAESRRRDLLLPRGKPLDEARELAGHPEIPLSPEIAAFIAASARRVRRSDLGRLAAAASFAAIALAAAAMGVFARREELIAERRTHQSEDLMGYMVGDLADKLRPLGRLDLLSGVGEKALSYFGDAKPDALSSTERRAQAKALQTLAEVARAHADPKAANDALRLASMLLGRELAQGREDAGLLKDLGANAFWIGQMALDQNRLGEAEAAFEDYRRFADRMMAIDPDNVDGWVELSYAYTNLGSVARDKGDLRLAQSNFEQSVALKRRALERRPDDRDLRWGLANSLSWLGSTLQAAGELRPALDLFDQEQSELNALRTAFPSEQKWTYRLVAAMDRHAKLLSDLGDSITAEQELRIGRSLAESLIQKDPSNRLWLKERLAIDIFAGRNLAALGKLPQALELQSATAEDLAQHIDSGEREWRRLEISNLLYLAETLLHLGRPAEARQPIERALSKARTDSDMSDAYVADLRSFGLILLAQTQTSKRAAREECQKAASLLQPLLSHNPTDDFLQDMRVRAHLCLGKEDQARDSIAWLARIGYRNASYLFSLQQPK